MESENDTRPFNVTKHLLTVSLLVFLYEENKSHVFVQTKEDTIHLIPDV